MKKNVVGHLVRIMFLDHCTSIGGVVEPISCTVWGICIKEDRKAYYVASWISEGLIDDNTDCHTILKSTVTSMQRIRKEGVLK